MKIEVGKHYRTRDGRKIGPVRRSGVPDEWPFRGSTGCTYRQDGTQSFNRGEESVEDLIAEWSDSPVREVTRKEIVPGTYGHIEISDAAPLAPEGVSLWFPRNRRWKAAELRDAIATLTAIADALEGNDVA